VYVVCLYYFGLSAQAYVPQYATGQARIDVNWLSEVHVKVTISIGVNFRGARGHVPPNNFIEGQ